jgi:hydrogenase maturation factor
MDADPRAIGIMEEVFMSVDAHWRRSETIPESGLSPREEFNEMDAAKDLPEDIVCRTSS